MRQAMRAGKNPDDVLYTFGRRETVWLAVHAAERIRIAPNPMPDMVYLLGQLPRVQRLVAVFRRLAVAGVERPTIAAREAALDVGCATTLEAESCSSSHDAPTEMLAFVLDALGCEEASMSRTTEAPAVTDNGWERVTVEVAHLQSPSCQVRLENERTSTPPDVNQPGQSSSMLRIEGTRADGPSVKLSKHTYSNVHLEVAGSAKDRRAIPRKVARAFGEPAQRK
jgi:hypothetical protein